MDVGRPFRFKIAICSLTPIGLKLIIKDSCSGDHYFGDRISVVSNSYDISY